MQRVIKRGDVYFADLNPVLGSEQGGNIRPVVVIQNNVGNIHSPTVIVAAVTSRGFQKHTLPTHVRLSGAGILSETSIVLLEQIRTIDRIRLRKYIGSLDELWMNNVDYALAVSVGLDGKDV